MCVSDVYLSCSYWHEFVLSVLLCSGVNMKVSIPPSGPDKITILTRKKSLVEMFTPSQV